MMTLLDNLRWKRTVKRMNKTKEMCVRQFLISEQFAKEHSQCQDFGGVVMIDRVNKIKIEIKRMVDIE